MTLFLGPGFWLVARWNRLVEPVKTRKEREKTGQKWARYGLKGVDVVGFCADRIRHRAELAIGHVAEGQRGRQVHQTDIMMAMRSEHPAAS